MDEILNKKESKMFEDKFTKVLEKFPENKSFSKEEVSQIVMQVSNGMMSIISPKLCEKCVEKLSKG